MYYNQPNPNMNPVIESFVDHDGTLRFTVKQINVSLANAVRRTILSDIPTYCFRTLPHAENRVQITTNTTRLNNEIIKQRMGCIPIHIKFILLFQLIHVCFDFINFLHDFLHWNLQRQSAFNG